MEQKKLKVAMISAGMVATHGHMPAYRALADKVRVCAVCDLNAHAAQRMAERFEIPNAFSNVETMLEEERPDLVSICTPNATHADLVKLALQYGANVICEKPLALRYADAAELFQLAKARGRILVACQTSRFRREYFAAREYIEDGALGEMYYAEINRIRQRGMPTWGTFHKKNASGGGALADIGVHALDALLWMLGSPAVQAVSGTAGSYIIREERGVYYSLPESGAISGVDNVRPFDPEECDVEEFAAGSIRAEGGLRINFKVAWAANLPNSNGMTILGSKAGITLPDMKLYSTMGKNQIEIQPRLFSLGAYDQEPFPGHYYLIGNVVEHLLEGAELIVKPDETLNVMAAIDLFYRAVELGREVTMVEVTG